MNRFQKFLDETGIAAGHRHTAAERASYFIWYHMRATGEPEADLEVIAAYLNESGTTVPELHGLYEELVRPGQLVTRAPIPGRLRTSSAKSMDEKYQVSVFESKGLAPLYFYRAANGGLIRVGSIKDVIKYWPHRSWIDRKSVV